MNKRIAKRHLEERIILLCLRSSLSSGEMRDLRLLYSECDEELLYKRSKDNHVLNVVASRLAALKIECPIKDWNGVATANERRIRQMEEVAVEIFREARRLSVVVAMFEASGVLYSSHQGLEEYGSSDFDLLVEKSDLGKVEQILVRLGMVEVDRKSRVKVLRKEFRGSLRDGREFWIDVGWKPFERSLLPLNYPDVTGLWLSRTVTSSKRKELRTLKAEDLLVQVAIHTSLHSYVYSPGVRLHIDVDRLVRDNKIEWCTVIDGINCLGFKRRAYFSLALAKRLLGTPIPEWVIVSLSPGRLESELGVWLVERVIMSRGRKENSFSLAEKVLLEYLMRGKHPSSSASKRAIDIVGSVTLLILLFPLMIIVSLLIRLTMGSPVFFLQERPGLGEKVFTIRKFRTMDKAEKGEVWFRTDEKRVTRLGRWLRSTSIDELPELFNVLIGEMSLVGPRPLLTDYLQRYTPEERCRHYVKPGITGLAQVSGRQALVFSKRISQDIWYANNWSLWLDFKILAKTIITLLNKDAVVTGQDVDSVDDLGLSSDTVRRQTRGLE